MTLIITNLTRPGEEPQDGDFVREEHPNGLKIERMWVNRAPAAPRPVILDQGQFKLLFTFAEREAEIAYRQEAVKRVQAGPIVFAVEGAPTAQEYDDAVAYARAKTYLTMRDDFEAASHINLSDGAVSVTLDFYVALGLIAPERKAQVLANEQPS